MLLKFLVIKTLDPDLDRCIQLKMLDPDQDQMDTEGFETLVYCLVFC
jgi:hypothetical protein